MRWVKNPDVEGRRLDDVLVVVNLKTHSMLELNHTAARVYELLETGGTVSEISEQLASEYEAPLQDIEEDVARAIDQMNREGLVRPIEVEVPATEPARTDGWLLRWEVGASRPELLGNAWSHREPNGDLTVFDGWVTDEAPLRDPRRWDELRGAFVVARANLAEGTLVVRRDGMGQWPAYYAFDGRMVWLSSHLNALKARLGRVELNRTYLAEWVRGLANDAQLQETLYRGISRVPAGHEAHIRATGVSTRRVWDPLPPGFAWARDEEAAQLLPTLETAVERALQAGANGIALSSGYDSVTLAILAKKLRGADRRPLQALSVHFRGTIADEGEAQREAARLLGMPSRLEPIDLLLSGDFVSQAVGHCAESPLPILSIWQGLYSALYAGVTDLGVSKVLLGTGGDEMGIVDPALTMDLIRRGEFRTLQRFLAAWIRTSPFSAAVVTRELLWREGLRPMARDAVVPWLETRLPRAWRTVRRWRTKIPEPVPPISEAVESRRAPAQRDPDGAYVAAMRGLYRSPVLAAELDQGWAWARTFGITPMLPFYDRDVVELALRIRPETLYASGRMKSPLRNFAQAELPQLKLPARKVDFTRVGTKFLLEGMKPTWKRLGGVPALAELGWSMARGRTRSWRGGSTVVSPAGSSPGCWSAPRPGYRRSARDG